MTHRSTGSLIVAGALALLTGCVFRQAQFASAEAQCAQNLGACKQMCAMYPDSAECAAATTQTAETIATQGNPDHLSGPSLDELHRRLLIICNQGVKRACAANDQLAGVGARAAANAQAAQRVADQQRKEHEEQQAKEQAEDALVQTATDACDAKPDECKAKCETEAVYCVAWSKRLRAAKIPKLVEARAYLKRACDGGVQAGCRAIADLEREEQQAAADKERERQQVAAESEQRWGEIVAAADDLARKSYGADWALRTSPKMQTQMAVARMRKVAAATVVEVYCPAKSDFVRGTSVAEFTKRAADHCANQAPTSNEGVALTTQCRAAFANSCPAPTPRRQAPPDDAVNTSAEWQAVRDAGDRLAQNRQHIRVTVDLNPTPRNISEAEAYRRYEPTFMGQAYCPAKQTFVAQFGAAEFAKRAAAHCQGDPPTAEGLSGAQVPLGADCRDAFALPCR